MAIMITTECINCGACEPECPNNAIYEGGANWALGGQNFGATDSRAERRRSGFFSSDYFYIVPDKCTECVTFHDEPQCAAVCPVDCCIPDPNWVEPQEQLEAKVKWLDEVDPGRKR